MINLHDRFVNKYPTQLWNVNYGKLVTRMAAFQWMHLSPVKHRYVWLPRKCDYRKDRHADGRRDRRRTKWSLCAAMLRRRQNKYPTQLWNVNYGQLLTRMAAFLHVLPVKHTYVWLPRKYDYRKDRHADGKTDRRRTKWSLCATMLHRWHKNQILMTLYSWDNNWILCNISFVEFSIFVL